MNFTYCKRTHQMHNGLTSQANGLAAEPQIWLLLAYLHDRPSFRY